MRVQVEDAKLLISVHQEYLPVYQDMDEASDGRRAWTWTGRGRESGGRWAIRWEWPLFNWEGNEGNFLDQWICYFVGSESHPYIIINYHVVAFRKLQHGGI